LIAVAERLRRRVRGSDLVGRLGGDDHVVVAGPVPTVGDIEHIRVTLAEALAQPFEVLDRELGLGGSIGVALYPRDGTTPEKLLRVADQSMYATKRRRKQRRHGPAPDGQAG
ncbi:MAG TPA: GGDEF domain-containing protein, partial [Plasticicumulans sp.]|nr:GGDEF domain-containing protein [Plasticicumulans sp.]